MTHTVLNSWPRAMIRLSFSPKVRLVLVTNSATNAPCLMMSATKKAHNRPIPYFFYDIEERFLRDIFACQGGRTCLRADLVQVMDGKFRNFHFNLYLPEGGDQVKLTIHRDPECLKGSLVKKIPLGETGYYLAETMPTI